jgi:lambda repressor-like predicted transcriptional regulator
MKKQQDQVLRIVDLDPATFAASARPEPQQNRREAELLRLYEQGASIESLQRRSGFHPSTIWTLLGLQRETKADEAAYAKALGLYHHMKSIIERDE